MNLFVTGNSSGLGRGLTEVFLQRGWRVYGCSRRGCGIDSGALHDIRCDLSDFDTVPAALERLLGEATGLDLVILNAGILGGIKLMTETSMDELRRIMDINVWSNKVILDWLHGWGRPVKQIVMISSGASVLGNRGWGGYALSKAALNMLARLYSHEFPDTHISAIAPGLIDTSMMDYLCVEPDVEEFPALQRIRNARGTEAMPRPRQAAERILEALPHLSDFPSGSFIDIRQILAPDEYRELMAGRAPNPAT
jgi:NAD(P)-dependent dehydrogenase (short-subunit alcohol dehydrogenase family)